MTHTPGPWFVPNKSYGWDHFAAIVTKTGMVATCHIAALSRSHEQTAADAHLIAAAPDLLAALEALLADCGETMSDGYVENSIHSDEVNIARAAIAKARNTPALHVEVL